MQSPKCGIQLWKRCLKPTSPSCRECAKQWWHKICSEVRAVKDMFSRFVVKGSIWKWKSLQEPCVLCNCFSKLGLLAEQAAASFCSPQTWWGHVSHQWLTTGEKNLTEDRNFPYFSLVVMKWAEAQWNQVVLFIIQMTHMHSGLMPGQSLCH